MYRPWRVVPNQHKKCQESRQEIVTFFLESWYTRQESWLWTVLNNYVEDWCQCVFLVKKHLELIFEDVTFSEFRNVRNRDFLLCYLGMTDHYETAVASLSISQQPGLLLVANHYSLSSFPNRRAAEGRCSGLPANATRRMWSRLRRVSSSGGPGFGRHWWRNRVARKRRRWERLADYIYMSFVMYEVHTVVS